MKSNYVWIVEIKEGRKWSPTCGVQLNRDDARREIVQWREDNPNDKFRLRKYIAA